MKSLLRLVFNFIIFSIYAVSAFNVDITVPVIKTTGRLDSYFGFSVAQHYMKSRTTGEINYV